MTETMTPRTTLLSRPISRRGFLAATGAAGASLALINATGQIWAAPAFGPAEDLAIARFAASLEVLAVNTYQAALDAASAGKLGAVPPAVATYAQTAQSHHKFALDQWNAVITRNGGAAVTAPPADLNAIVAQAFGQVTNVRGVAELALLLEQTAADTYFKAVPMIENPAAIDLAGNFLIIDQQHASILLFVLGRYPVPETFQSGAKAATPSGAGAAGARGTRDSADEKQHFTEETTTDSVKETANETRPAEDEDDNDDDDEN